MKSSGHLFRLNPVAKGPQRQPLDDDWLLKDVNDEFATLENTRTKGVALIGLDAIHSRFSDPERSTPTEKYGFLHLHAEVQMAPNGKVSVTPLPPPRTAGAAAPTLRPLVLNDGDEQRSFTWRRRDPVHLLDEEQPKQLMGFFVTLCEALRRESGLEPEFHSAADIRGEIVYELSPDHRARYRLLGGMGGSPGRAVLVLTDRPAQSSSTESTLSAPSGVGKRRSYWRGPVSDPAGAPLVRDYEDDDD